MTNARDGRFRDFDFELRQQPPEDFLERHVKRTADGIVFEANNWWGALAYLSGVQLWAVFVVVVSLLGAGWFLGEWFPLFVICVLGAMLGVALVGYHGFVEKRPLSTEWNNTSRTIRHSFIGGFRHGELLFRYDDALGFNLRSESADGLTSHHLYMAIQFGASVEESSQWIWPGATPRRRQFIVSPSGFWKSIFELRFVGPSQPRDYAEFELTPVGFQALEDLERARDVLIQATGLPAKVVSLGTVSWAFPLRPNVM